MSLDHSSPTVKCRWVVILLIRRSGLSVVRSSRESVCRASMISENVPGHVNPKGKRTGLVKVSAFVSGTWKELDPRTGVTAPP